MNPLHCLPSLLIACCLLPVQTLLAQAPAITTLYPAGMQRGTTAEIALEGKPGAVPLQAVAADGGQLQLTVSEKGDKLTIAAAAEETPGLRWLRLYNASGANTLLPFFLGTLPETVEKEPNDTRETAGEPLALPLVVNGKLQKNGDLDNFAVSLKAGQTLIASLDAHRSLASPMDAAMQLVDSHNFVVQQNDDDHGYDPLISWTAPADGLYYVRVYAFPAAPNSSIVYAGGASYIYRLTLTTGPFIAASLPDAASPESPAILQGWNLESTSVENAAETPGLHLLSAALRDSLPVQRKILEPQELTLPGTFTRNLTAEQPLDRYLVTLEKGQGIRIQALARRLDSLLDPYLVIREGDKFLREVDDIARDQLDIDTTWKAPSAGTFTIEISDRYRHTGDRYFYLLKVEAETPRVDIKLAENHYAGKAGEAFSLPVTITRLSGFAETISFELTGLPETVTVAAPVSENKGDSAKQVTLKLTNTGSELFQGPVQLIARWGSEDNPQQQPAQIAVNVPAYSTDHFWLTLPGTPAPAQE